MTSSIIPPESRAASVLPELAGLQAILLSVSVEESAVLAALATSTVSQAVVLRQLPKQVHKPRDREYVPHPLDVLIFAALEESGAMPQADLLAALDKDTYPSRGRNRRVTGTALKNRLPELVDAGVLRHTTAGYLIADRDAVAQAEGSFSAEASPPTPDYIPHPLDVLIFAAIDQEGAMQQAELLAALSSDTYESRGRTRTVSAATLQRRLPELVSVGALAKTPAGYITTDPSFAIQADKHFDGGGLSAGVTEYVPHPLDVLIFAVISQEGAMGQAGMLAALAGDVYTSQGRDRAVSAGTLKRRLPELIACGALFKTAGGYGIRDHSVIDIADATFKG